MTTFAEVSRAQVAYIAETTYGNTPATPTTVLIPFVNFNINPTIDQFQDTSIRSDRQHRYSISGNQHVTGDLQVNLNNHNFDPFLASVVAGAWATNVLKVGSTQTSFTFEQGSLDIGQYFLYTGVMMDKLALTVNTTGMVDAKFSVVAQDALLSSTTICATPTAITEKQPFVHLGGTFKEGGAVTALISAIVLNVDNKLTANFTLGSPFAQNLSSGMIDVTGTATVMFQDAVIANKFLNGTASVLDFTLTDGTNTMEFTLPNVKYTGLTRSVSGSGPIMLTLPFTALYDATTATVMTITRSS